MATDHLGVQPAVTDLVPYLDEALLARYEDALRRAGAVLPRVWAAGLSDAEIDAHLQGLDLDLPEEARRWWRWHNGCVPGTRGPDWDLTPTRTYYDLATSLGLYRDYREIMLEMDGVNGRIMPMGGERKIYLDCRVARDAPAPIYAAGQAEDQRLVLPSIGAMVSVWIELIETGVYATNPDGTWKRIDDDRVPPEIVRLEVY